MGPERTFIVERALRTLVKQRDAEALALREQIRTLAPAVAANIARLRQALGSAA